MPSCSSAVQGTAQRSAGEQTPKHSGLDEIGTCTSMIGTYLDRVPPLVVCATRFLRRRIILRPAPGCMQRVFCFPGRQVLSGGPDPRRRALPAGNRLHVHAAGGAAPAEGPDGRGGTPVPPGTRQRGGGTGACMHAAKGRPPLQPPGAEAALGPQSARCR